MDEHWGYGTPFTDVVTILPQPVTALNAKTRMWCCFKASLKLIKHLNVANVPAVVFVHKLKCWISFQRRCGRPKCHLLKILQLFFQANLVD